MAKDIDKKLKRKDREILFLIGILVALMMLIGFIAGAFAMKNMQISEVREMMPQKVHFDNLNFIDSNQAIAIQNLTIEWGKK